MKLLIDSHALIWYVDQHQQLSPASHAAMSDSDNELLLSAGSIWEIAFSFLQLHKFWNILVLRIVQL